MSASPPVPVQALIPAPAVPPGSADLPTGRRKSSPAGARTSAPVPAQREAAPAPTSLTQRAARAGQRCPSCGGDRLTRIGMTLTDGSPVDFASCRSCEWRAWQQHGVTLDLPRVLDKARKIK